VKRMVAIARVLLLVVALWWPIVSKIEQPKYTVVETHGDVEIRDYAPMIVAEVAISGEREKAISEGFRTIADYIFGDNASALKVPMTAPVSQQASEKIPMTAPVTQQGDGTSWEVRFVMPASYTLATLPKPKNPAVKLVEIGGKRLAAIRFSGVAGKNNLKRHRQELQEFVAQQGLQPLSSPAYAFYDPPWTLPFLRRNEVMIEIAKPPGP